MAEFLSAIAGAIVGGIIAYVVQIHALREGRVQQPEDRKLTRQAHGRALLIKMGRIVSNYDGIQRHFESCFERAKQNGFGASHGSLCFPQPTRQITFTSPRMNWASCSLSETTTCSTHSSAWMRFTTASSMFSGSSTGNEGPSRKGSHIKRDKVIFWAAICRWKRTRRCDQHD